MSNTDQSPLYEVTRGGRVESIHFGSIAVSDNQGHLVAWYGDPNTVSFLRSSAKPFQALPFIEAGGAEKYDLSSRDIAISCASHSGTEQHLAQIHTFQNQTGVVEEELRCGIHPPYDEITAFKIRKEGQQFTPNRNNCSGKHTGMLAFSHMQNWPTSTYLVPDHPLQKLILRTFSEMCGVSTEDIIVGIDGCSAPNFAVPIMNTALAYARLCDPQDFSKTRADACRNITNAMTKHPFLVAGTGRFDTLIMEAASGRIVSKAGAEGYQAMGIMPGTITPDSPALGIAFKISDGDLCNRARPAIALEILYQLEILSDSEKRELAKIGPTRTLKNLSDIEIGIGKPAFQLNSILSST